MKHLLILLIINLLLPHPQLTSQTIEETIYEDYDKNMCTYCITNGVFSYGRLYVYTSVHGQQVGYCFYNTTIPSVKYVIVDFVFAVNSYGILAVWLNPNNPRDDVIKLNNENKTIVLSNEMIGPGVSIVLTKSGWTVLITSQSGFTNATTIAGGDWSKTTPVSVSGDTVAYHLVVGYTAVNETIGYLYLKSRGVTLYESIGPFPPPYYEPKFVSFLARSLSGTAGISYLDYVNIRFRNESMFRMPPLDVTPIYPFSPLGVNLIRTNKTHVIVSFVCQYIQTPNECPKLNVTLSYMNGTIIYTAYIYPHMYCDETRKTVVFRETIYVGENPVKYIVCSLETNRCETGVLEYTTPPLEENPYTAFLTAIIPLSAVIALAVRTRSMKDVGLGLIASGIVISFLPALGISPNEIFALGTTLAALGLVVLFLYRT